jgi:hypothetical protein
MSEDTNAEETAASSGVSRRRVIKAGALVGGAVWVTPVIDSFLTRAAAASQPGCTPSSCPDLNSCGLNCFCFTTITGAGFCGPNVSCVPLADCGPNSPCPTGFACIESSCCGRNVCLQPCDAAGGAVSGSTRLGSGLTTAGI